MKKFIFAFLLGLIFCGCSITPRYHSFGYNVEWKTRGTTRAKASASPVKHRSESEKRSDLDRKDITGEENRSETAKTGSFNEDNRFLIDTIRKTEFSIPMRIELDTAEKNLRIENQDPRPTVVRDGHKSANWGLFLVLLGIAAVAVGGTFFITPIGYVLSIIGKQRSEKGSSYFKRAKAGTILGLITILLDLLVLLLVIAYFY